MSDRARSTAALRTGWYSAHDCRLTDLRKLVETTTELDDYPCATEVVDNVLIYGGRLPQPDDDRRKLQTELARALLEGPGVVVFRGAFGRDVVDAASAAFTRLIDEQKAAGSNSGDHFAAAGANDRVWGALDKLALADPQVFADYYANDVLALVSRAWLGPDYQLTSQVNVVNPGGQAQVAHRDYHLGFMDCSAAQQFPAHIQALSPALTLQGAVAHCDMPVESGPTMFLPHSQKYPQGYLAFHDAEFSAYFERHHVQLPLATGDAVFFNPALLHGAGANHTTDVVRMANLLQVSSAFGRAMETVDTTAISLAVFPILQQWVSDGVSARTIENVVTAAAEGYPFPTNLDHDQPIGSMAPPSQAAVLRTALARGWEYDRLRDELAAQQARRRG